MFNPSKDVTFGLVTAEAMACGTPAIVYKETAGEEIVSEETGYVIDKVEDVLPLIAECNAALSKQASACKRSIVDNFNSDTQYMKYIEMYETVL